MYVSNITYLYPKAVFQVLINLHLTRKTIERFTETDLNIKLLYTTSEIVFIHLKSLCQKSIS